MLMIMLMLMLMLIIIFDVDDDVDDHVDVDFDAVQGGGGPVLHAGPPIASSNTFLAAPFLAAAAAQSTIPAQELSDRQEADMLVSFCHSFHFFF